MSCPQLERSVALYAGGDLSPEDLRAVEEHLGVCSACAELAASLERDRGWLAALPHEAAQADYDAMRRRIRLGIAVRRRPRVLLPALLAAAAILLAAVTVTIQRAPHQPAPRPVAPVAMAAVPHAPAPRPRPTPPRPPADLTLEDAIKMLAELDPPPPPPAGPDSATEIHISTRDPNITIILVQETKGASQ